MQILNAMLFICAGIILFALLIRWFEKQIVFHPSRYPEGYWQPQNFGLQTQDVYFKAGEDLQLHGWYLPHPQAIGQILMCHGNAGNVSDRLELISMLHKHVPANIFIFDYRGFGRSQGAPSEDGVYEDAMAAFDWLHSAAPHLPVIVHGHSLGSAVAVDLATRRSTVAALVLESPFTNARDMTRLMFGGLPVQWLTTMRWASDEKIADLRMPKLFLHGGRDATVPLHLGEKLFDAAPDPKEFVIIAHADHNNLYVADGEKYFGAINRLLGNCAKESKSEKIQPGRDAALAGAHALDNP